jgi:hypothetical protein
MDPWVVGNLPSLARSYTEAMLGGKYCVVCVNTGGLCFSTGRFLLELLDEIEAMLVTFYNKRSYYRGTH